MPPPAFRRFSFGPWSVIALLWTVVAVLFALSATVDWATTWRLVRVPPMWPPFADLRTITGGLDTLAAGGDPLVANPFDPWHRPMNYPRIWLWAFRAAGINDANVWIVGALFVTLFLLAVSSLIRAARTPAEALLIGLAGLSFASLFAMERGNSDLLAFVLVLVALTSSRLGVALGALVAAAVLKLFPIVGFLVLGSARRPGWRAAAVAAAALTVAILLASLDDLMLIARGTPVSALWSYGVVSIFDLVGRYAGPLHVSDAAQVVVGGLVTILIWLGGLYAGLVGWRRPMRDLHAADGGDADRFLAFGLIYAATFFVGSNYVYRLIFLIPLLPWLCRAGRRPIVGPATGFHVTALLLFVLNVDAAGRIGLVIGHAAKLATAYVALYLSAGMLRHRLVGPTEAAERRAHLPRRVYHQAGMPSTNRFRIAVGAFVVLIATVITGLAAQVQKPEAPRQAPLTAEDYSPLGFYDLRAYEQAFPASPSHPIVRQAASARYWVYNRIAYRAGTGAAEGRVWTSLGPESLIRDPTSGGAENVSGRVSALAISPTCTLTGACRLWVGTAGGGVWRTDDAMNPEDPRWVWVGTGLGTNNIGSLGLDPNDRTGNTIFVGTGETNTPHNSGAGTGLYKSTDGGGRWTRVTTMATDPVVSPAEIDFTLTRGIGAVVIEPGNSQTMYVATTTAMLGMTAVRGGQTQSPGFPQPRVGLYKTENGGVTWRLIWAPPRGAAIPANPNLGAGVGDTMEGVRDVKLDPRDPRIVYATAFNNAIHRLAASLEGGDASFKPVFAIVDGAGFRDLAMFDLTVRDGRTRIYAYNGTESTAPQSLYRLDNADVPAGSLVTVNSSGTAVNTGAWIKLSTDDLSSPGSTSRRICSSQCFYDLVVATPAGQPDTVIIGGVQTPDFGEATIRSTNAGEAFGGFGNDAQNPRNLSHVDVRAVVFHPKNPNIAFVGSDGGVVRNDGVFVSNAQRCQELFGSAAQCRTALASVPQRLYFLNKGLQTLQFYNVEVDHAAPLRRLIGGLQDNGTIWLDGTTDTRVWRSLFPFGDGTSASGFHPTRSEVVFASFQSNRYFTNFRNGDLARWVRTDDPIRASNERATITASTGRQFITFDYVRSDTQFTAFQHVWRTENNGGTQAFLEANCRFPSGAIAGAVCGDWVPLGVPFPFASGTTPASASRKPGDLTSDFYGTDRAGGIIVAAERARSDTGTLWAATNFGRLFVTKNVDAPGAAVAFTRVDTPLMPNRFVTRIVVDRADANVAYISYSGFNAITPGTPGHVFRAVYDPATGRASFTSLDFDLGDLPINTLAFDDVTKDVYAGTDFGPLVLRNGASFWTVAGIGFPEALMVDLEIVPERRLLIGATHGMGIFYLELGDGAQGDGARALGRAPSPRAPSP